LLTGTVVVLTALTGKVTQAEQRGDLLCSHLLCFSSPELERWEPDWGFMRRCKLRSTGFEPSYIWGVCRGLAAGSIAEAKSLETPFSAGTGGLSQPSCNPAPHAAQQRASRSEGLLGAERRVGCWLANLGLGQ